jgi:Brp/Blh family beta-carotene 15,15'-monooxygenase
MPRVSQARQRSGRHVRTGRGDLVHPAYWAAAAALIVAILAKVPLGQPAVVAASTLIFLVGGLPHGAYDIALLRRTGMVDRRPLSVAVLAYIAVAAGMALLWNVSSLAALVLFLIVAAVHFGEDWRSLDEPLLRFAAGAAIIAAPALGHPADVAHLFIEMSDQRAAVVAQLLTAIAPVTLLVTGVGVVIAWQEGSRAWAAATSLCLALLVAVPPVSSFALFFVFLHSPRHLAETKLALRDMTRGRWMAIGALLSMAAIGGFWALQSLATHPVNANWTARAFQLLASVAVPHLLLTRWLEQRLAIEQGHITTGEIAFPGREPVRSGLG